MVPNTVILSVPTSGAGATAAATYAFMTSGYMIPRQNRSTGSDVVHNQNGIFVYRYDNGPGQHIWQPFQAVVSDEFAQVAGGGATQQAANLEFLWRYIGPMGMRAPEGTYQVAWADAPIERRFGAFPAGVGDKLAYNEVRVTINLEEA